MKYVELSKFLHTKSIDKKLIPYLKGLRTRFWGVLLILGLIAMAILFGGLQKLRNDQVELAQPDASFVFEGDLTLLPAFGQTFIPRQAGLRGIYIPLNVEASWNDTAALILHLRADPKAAADIRTVTLSLAGLEGQNLAHFSFEPLPDSFNTRYYFFLEPSSEAKEAKIKLYYSGPTTYLDGALYINNEPQDFQANFFLVYDRLFILRDWGSWFVKNLLSLLSLALFVTLPGGALLTWLWPKSLARTLGEDNPLNHVEWLALAAGLSVAVYPILLLLADIVGLKVGTVTIIMLLVLSAIAITAGIYGRKRRHLENGPGSSRATVNSWGSALSLLPRLSFSPPLLLFWLVFVLSAAIRILVMRGQDVPLWQDSFHHTVISQLIVNNGGLFNSWAPYAPLETFSYHFGFHALVAAYHWLTGSNIFQAVIAIGQLMNLLTVPAAFLLGRRLGGSDWAGAFAALITGLLSEQPMAYVNWGRYTQLTSQVILPGVMILTWLALKTRRPNYKLIGLICLGLAGLALTHYRVLFFYPCFIMPILLLELRRAERWPAILWTSGWRLAAIAGGTFIMISPWLWRLAGGILWQIGSSQAAAGPNNELIQAVLNVNSNIFDYMPPLIVILGLVGMVWGSWQHQEGILITVGWGIMLLLIANPHFVYLPGAALITYFAVLIASYLPFSILAAFTLARVAQALNAWQPVSRWGIVVVALGIGLIGAQERSQAFKPMNAMVTKPDLAAAAWVRENTPVEAVFWVNSRVAYASLIVGTDAGWWLPFLTGRRALVLPMIYGTEVNTPFDYPTRIHELYQKIQQSNFASHEVWQTLQQAGVTHIYIGQRRGEVWRGAEQPLDPVVLQNSPYYQLVYRRDQVYIFALKQL